MGYFCFGTFTRMLISCCPNTVTNKKMCGTLLLCFRSETFIYDIRTTDDTVNKILCGGQNLPVEIIDLARTTSILDVESYIDKEIIPFIDATKKKQLVLGLKELVNADKKMDGTTQLGTSRDLTKEIFLKTNKFAVIELLSNLLLYVITKIDNTTHKKEMKLIKRKYCDKFDAISLDIELYEHAQIGPITSIPMTAKTKKFNSIFKEVSAGKLGIGNPNDIRIFRIDIENNEFHYDYLDKYLLNSVGYYVFSRLQVQQYKDDDEIELMAVHALRAMNENGAPDEKATGNELGELLLYVFLESVLGAPKLMSKVELSGFSAAKGSRSDGIHLLTSGGVVPFNQIVFGASMVDEHIADAINNAFTNVQNVILSRTKEYRLVESSAFYQVFDDKTKAVARSIIMPQEGNVDKTQMSFGLFIGYSLNIEDKGYDRTTYEKEVELKMENDILGCIEYINHKIRSLGLSAYSFYVYTLPFNKAIIDKKQIMERLMNLGGDK